MFKNYLLKIKLKIKNIIHLMYMFKKYFNYYFYVYI